MDFIFDTNQVLNLQCRLFPLLFQHPAVSSSIQCCGTGTVTFKLFALSEPKRNKRESQKMR